MSGRVVIVAHATYPADPRVRRQAETLVDAGHGVDVIALRESGEPAEARIGGVRVVRLPIRRRFNGFAGHLAEYLAFATLASVRVAREHRHRRYRLVQVATLPDFLVAAAIVPKLAGVPLLLDLHEDMPAFFDDRFATLPLRPMRPIVSVVARGAAAMADHVLTVHEPLRALAIARGLSPERVTVVMNGADERHFDASRHPRRGFMADGTLRLVHHSALQRIYGLHVAVHAMARLRRQAPELSPRLDIYGDGPHRTAIESAIAEVEVGEIVRLHGRIPMDDVPGVLAAADAALVPSLPEPYMQLSLSTKLLEAVAMGVPVIASDLATFRMHFDAQAIRYVPGGDPAALALAIADLPRDPATAATRAAEARRQGAPYAWSVQAKRYLGVVERLLARP